MKPFLNFLRVFALLAAVHTPLLHAQSVLPPTPANASQQRTDTLSASDTEPLQQDSSMPAEDLIQLLRGNPEVMVEVKSVIADSAQQQGVNIQADSLTDQQVYARLDASASLRTVVTQFLRARGYVSEADIAAARRKSQSNVIYAPQSKRSLDDSHISAREPSVSNEVEISSDDKFLAAPLDDRQQPASRATTPHSSQQSVQPQPNITDDPSALHRPTPYNMRSLRDLYTQVPDASQPLKRFGSELFNMYGAAGFKIPADRATSSLDMPLGPSYVIGPGDQLNITLWGGISQNNLRIVDREGRVSLPEAGLLPIAGLTLQKAQDLIAAAMEAQFRNAKVAVSVAQVRSIRIYVVGDVQRPGAYEISALASPITALFAAGGPTAVGSLRILRHLRNQSTIGEIDLYDFMLHGIQPSDDRLESGDTLLVPPVGPQVAIAGAIRRPAIYELKDEKNLAAVLDDAGGLTVAASLSHITIDRVVASQRREEFAVSAAMGTDASAAYAVLSTIAVQDGDRVRVASVLPYSERAVYLQGHVARPGKIAYRDGMQLGDVLRNYQDLLPEPADRGEIVRLVPPDLHPVTIAFNIPDLLIGNTNAPLQPFDTVRVYGRYELDPSMVSIRGEVQRPGDYPMFKGMTASDLVRTAGGFKRDALIDRADLASYKIEDGTRVVVQRQDVAIGEAVLKRDQVSDVSLKPGDVLTIHQLTGWNDIGASVILEGEVAHPGSYGFQEGEHLSDVLRRSGGFRSTAYPEGAVLTRPEVATLEEKSREELIRQIEESAASTRVSPSASGGDQAATLQLIQQQKQQAISQLRSQPAVGRLVIHIDSDMSRWAGTPADIELRSGDTLRIPKRPGFVLVTGQVFNPSAITFIPGRSAGWYLERAGGATSIANRKEIFIVRANGAVVGRGSAGWLGRDVLSTHLNPGDTIVVPQRFIGPSVTWRNLLATAQIAASLAIAAAVAGL